ncbi:tryptophan synthase subunit beta [Candidatus Gottesmanbacteria bacterium]|nr:tryptophan synthase subunit beta [Candidatus Gottesmanbacteria bacterium]
MNRRGYFGKYGGQFVPEFLYPALTQLEKVFWEAKEDKEFLEEYDRLLAEYAGRPTPLYFAQNTSKLMGCRVYFKREDLVSGGSHKLNNALGQALLTKYMGKKQIITETAAGMHGVATSMAANVIGLSCNVFMGVKDIERQKINAEKIKLLGGNVIAVTRGSGVLKDAVSEALVSWIRDLPTTHYLIGSAVGPHPYPTIVAFFQKMIGDEARKQILKKTGKLPKTIIACGSGGSNALGIYQAFVKDKDVELVFVEGGGTSLKGTHHAAAFKEGSVGIFQGAKTYLVQDDYGMDRKTESRSAGLNYPARGPQLSYLYKMGRLKACVASDKEVLEAFEKMGKLEGLLPAFETCHAIAELIKRRGKYKKDDIVLLNFSGRGDKDIDTAIKLRI